MNDIFRITTTSQFIKLVFNHPVKSTGFRSKVNKNMFEVITRLHSEDNINRLIYTSTFTDGHLILIRCRFH